MSTLAELATRAADLIEAAPESAWTQCAYARDADGRSVPTRHSTAVCWCAVGHLRRNGLGEKLLLNDPVTCANDSAINRADAIARLRALAASVSA